MRFGCARSRVQIPDEPDFVQIEHPEKDIIDDEIDAAATSHVDRFEDIASKVKPLDRKRLRARKKDGYVSSDDYSSEEDYSDEGKDFYI